MKNEAGFDIDKFISILLHHGVVNSNEATALKVGFKKSSNQNFDDFLLSEGLIDREDILEALSIYYEVPSFDVVGYFFEHELLLKFPKDFLLRYEIIPLETDRFVLVVVASDPGDADLLSGIGKFVSYDIQFRVGIARDISDAVKEFYDQALTVLQDSDKVERQRREVLQFLEHEHEAVLEEEVERLDQ